MKHDPSSAAPPQRDWRSAIDDNRQLDEAVAQIEQAVWAPPAAMQTAAMQTAAAPSPAQPAAVPPAQARPTPVPPTPAPLAPVFINPAAPAPSARGDGRPTPLRMVAMSPAPMLNVKPAATPKPAPAVIVEDLDAVVRNLEAERDGLLRRRRALLADIAFLLPWSPTPRPALVADGGLFQVDDEELRDVIQPHWRAVAAQAAAAAAALAEARESNGDEPAWRRAWRRRSALKAAEDAELAARQALEAAELIWRSDSLNERREQLRRQAEQIRDAGLATVEGVPELDAAIAANGEALALAAALRERGVSQFERRPAETPAQAMARAATP